MSLSWATEFTLAEMPKVRMHVRTEGLVINVEGTIDFVERLGIFNRRFLLLDCGSFNLKRQRIASQLKKKSQSRNLTMLAVCNTPTPIKISLKVIKRKRCSIDLVCMKPLWKKMQA